MRIIHKTTYPYTSQQNSVTEDEVPLRRLQQAVELFFLTPRVFRCVAFIQDLYKLSLRTIKCIFVGYSRTKQDYRCFHPPTGRHFVSTNVTFFESQLYFDGPTSEVECLPLPFVVESSATTHNEPSTVNKEIPHPL